MLSFDKYYYGYDDEKGRHQPGYKEVAEQLLRDFPITSRNAIRKDDELKHFVRLYSQLLKRRNLLRSFDEFDLNSGYVLDENGEPTKERILINGAELQGYNGWYLELRDKFKADQKADASIVNDDVEFEVELVKSVQVDVSYILSLVGLYHQDNCKDKTIKDKVGVAVGGSPDLRDKRELIERFIDRVTAQSGDIDIVSEWDEHVEAEKKAELDCIISDEKLKPAETYRFVSDCFELGFLQTAGIAITKILPPMPIFGKGNLRKEKKQRVIDKLKAYFNRYMNI